MEGYGENKRETERNRRTERDSQIERKKGREIDLRWGNIYVYIIYIEKETDRNLVS